ncbi:MAG TPA: leucine-rich repeat protein [Ruminococcus sp.]
MKKLISLISAFAVAAFGAVPVISAGEDGGYSFEYSVNDSGTAVITGGTGSGSVLNIPSQIDGLTVTEIGEQAFSGLGSLNTVILPDSITKIGDLAFTVCPNLETFIVDSGNQNFSSVGGSLFSGSQLVVYAGGSSAVLPDNVRSIRKGAFRGKSGLTSVSLPDTLLEIGDSAFSGCTSLTEIDIPDSVNYIGKSCFLSCTALEKATLGTDVIEIPDDCFYSCISLNTVSIPEGVVLIGSDAFYCCSNLTGVYIPQSVTSIGSNAIGRRYIRVGGSSENIPDFRITGEANSAVQNYAESYGINFTIGEIPLGDINGDYIVNSIDASAVLTDYAWVSTGRDSSFNGWKVRTADFNCDGIVNSIDASAVLTFYARNQADKN